MNGDKLDYSAPTLTKIGTFETITQGLTTGSTYDQPIPAGPIPPQGTPVFS